VEVHQVNPGYLTALGITLSTGRMLAPDDVSARRPVAIVNERFVQARFGGRPPIGQAVRLPRLKDPPFAMATDTFEVVGVVRDTPNDGLANPAIPEVFLPFSLAGVSNGLIVHTALDPAMLVRSVTAQVYAIDPSQPVAYVQTLDTAIQEDAYSTPRFNLILLSVFAAMGLVLAIVGVYGVMSAAVAQQRHEIGVRMALGAGARTVARMIIMRGSRLLLIGMALGLAGSLLTARLLARQVWNVAPFDPLAFAIVSMVLLAAGLQACLWPALRAARTDPVVALRQD
jgi:ABC-type antimicrobial peptide transport system permease subunit